MKKVLFTATVDSHILQFHLPFLKLFKEKGYEVHVATNGNEEIPYCDVKHVISFERSPFKLNNIKAIKQLRKICNEEKFDIIHTHTPMGSVVTRLAAIKSRKKYNTRVIYTAHGLHFFEGAPRINWLVFYPIEKFLSRFTDTLVLINQEDYKLCKVKFKKCHDIQYVPGVGIDENKFDFNMTKSEKKNLRNSIGLDEDDFVMIYPAELNDNKNQIMLINTMKELVKKYSNIKLLLPGKDSYDGYYQRVVHDYNLDDYVKFLGFRKDIPKLLKISDLAVATSKREGLPVNIMEAMYVGLPIVATDCRGQRDLVKDHVNGYLVNLMDQERFTKSVEKIYLSRDKSFKFKEESQYMIKEYLLDKILLMFNDIYFKKTKVMHVLSSNKYSGAENVVCTIIEKSNNYCDSYYCSPSGEIKKILSEKKIDYINIKKLSLKNLKKIVKKVNPDYIHAHDIKASVICSLLSKNHKVISHIHKNDPNMSKISLKSLLYKLAANKFDKIVFVSETAKNEFIYKNKYTKKIKVIYNFVDKEKVLDNSKKYKVNKKYDFYYLGRLTEEKNPLMFIKIIEEISKEKKVSAVIIGDGPLLEKCRLEIETKNLNIDLVGFKENPYPYIEASNIGIMPSKYEGFGITAVEAYILNKPVLNSGVGGLKEIFKYNEELICTDIKDYVNKINGNVNYKLKYDDIFVNEKKYINSIINLYYEDDIYEK